MKRILQITSVGLLTCCLSGCAAVVASTAATGILVAQDRRSAGALVDDQTLELKARQAVARSLEDNDKAHVSVISYNNNLLLIGQAPNEELRNKIENSVRKVAQAGVLHNEIKLEAPTSLLTRSSDSWITTKIKSEMVLKKNFNPTRVKVVTEDGIVYLLGIVNKQEEEIAVEIARHTRGVKRVVKMFEYVAS